MPPRQKSLTHPSDISDKIIHFGGFQEGLDFVVKLMNSETASSLIIRGNVGSGKKTLIEEASKMCDVILIYLDPYHCTDDFAALRRISAKLGRNPRKSLQEVMTDIREQSESFNEKVVLVLLDFEEFCRQKQSLLYCLTDLTQHGHNFCLIGLTSSLDCTEHLEKRVRSRINTLFYELNPPYRNEKEYLEFASLLLDGHKITGRLSNQLKIIYQERKSIRQLKKYLISMCSLGIDDEFVVNQPAEVLTEDQMIIRSLTERIGWLTRPQLEMLKVAVSYCFKTETTDFSLQDLNDYTRRHGYSSFDTTSPLAIRNIATLAKIGLFKASKVEQMICQQTIFSIGVTPNNLRYIMENNPRFHCIKTDPFWKKMR